MPFGNCTPSATCRALPSGVTTATIQGPSKPKPPLTYALPRASTTISLNAVPASPLRSAYSAPSASSRRSCPDTTRSRSRPEASRPLRSGSQSIENGIVVSTRATTSAAPAESTASTSPAPQWQNHSRPSRQRGDSPIRSSSSSVFKLDGTVLQLAVVVLALVRPADDHAVLARRRRPDRDLVAVRVDGRGRPRVRREHHHAQRFAGAVGDLVRAPGPLAEADDVAGTQLARALGSAHR